MGLGMWAYSARTERSSKEDRNEMMYWSKHYHLDIWMRSLYEEKGGTDEVMRDFELTMEDLIRLEKDILTNSLRKKELMQEDDRDVYYEEYDLAFIQAAKRAIKKKLKVFYNSCG